MRAVHFAIVMFIFLASTLPASAGVWENVYQNVDHAYIRVDTSHGSASALITRPVHVNRYSHIYTTQVRTPTASARVQNDRHYHAATNPRFQQYYYNYAPCSFVSKSPPDGFAATRYGYASTGVYVCP